MQIFLVIPIVIVAIIVFIAIGSRGEFMAVADIVAPTPYYQLFKEVKRWGTEKPYSEKEVKQEEKLSEVELKERYDAIVLAEREKQISRGDEYD